MSTAQTAEFLDCSVRQVARLASRGDLKPAVKIEGRTGAYLFRRADVEALAAGAADAQDGAA